MTTTPKTDALIASLTLEDARAYAAETDKLMWIETHLIDPAGVNRRQAERVEDALISILEANPVSVMVKQYTKIFFPAGSTEANSITIAFTEVQAQSVGSDCYKEGVHLSIAKKLISKWNREARASGSKTTFAL